MNAMTRDQAIAQLTGAGAPYELLECDIQGRQLKVFRNAPNSLRELFAGTASALPFLIYEEERFTFAQAHAAAARIAHVLVQHCGVKPGERVAIALRNYPEWVLAFTAATSVGAVAVAMNGHWQAKELAYGLVDSGAKVLIADAERVERWTQCAPITGLQVLAVRATRAVPGTTLLSDLTNELGDLAMPEVSIHPDDPATILYTSGSTGHPKGVVSSHRNILSALLSWELDRGVGELMAGAPPPVGNAQSGTLLCAPLFHVTGLHASYLASYRLQRKMACMYRWDAEKAAALIDAERLTSVVAPAAMTGDLVRVAKTGQYRLDSLLLVGGGGAPRAPEQVRQIDASFSQALPNTVMKHRTLGGLVLATLILCVFAWPTLTLFPAYTRQRLGRAEETYSFLVSALGAGALVAAFTTATFGSIARRAGFLVLGASATSLGLLGLAVATGLPAALSGAAAVGFGLILFLSTGQSTLQLGVPDGIRGRVMALWAITLSASAPIGHLLAGQAAEAVGLKVVLEVMAAGSALVAIGLMLLVFRRRK